MAGSGFTLWIIDDDISFGRSLLRLTRAAGINGEYFQSAQSFLDAISPGRSGCVLADIRMPGMDGFELLSKMQSLHYAASIILMTGHMDRNSRSRALSNGAIGFLQKPFTGESMLDLLRQLGVTGDQK